MMLPKDALILAVTKLKTRRLRLAVTIIVAGLLFILLSTASIVMNGAINSVESFSTEGLGKRYIVSASTVANDEYVLLSEPKNIAKVKSLFEEIKKKKSAEAKRLGIEYEPTSEPDPIVDSGMNGLKSIDTTQSYVREYFKSTLIDSSSDYYSSLSKKSAEYGAIGEFYSVSISGSASYSAVDSISDSLTPIIDGKENLVQQVSEQNYLDRGFNTIQSGVTAISDEILESFLLPGQSLELKGENIPIIVPYSAAEQIIGLSPLNKSASTKDQLARIKEVRDSVANTEFDVCIRNSTSQTLQQEAAQMSVDAKANKDKEGYIQPDVVNKISTKPCQDVVNTRDVRSSYQKDIEMKQRQFEEKFGNYKKPTQRIVTFKIVGVAADPPSFESFSISDLLGSLLNSNIGSAWLMPLSAQKLLPEFKNTFNNVGKLATYSIGNFVEFQNADTAREFIKKESCSFDFFSGVDPAVTCLKQGKKFTLSPYGSNSIALEEVRTGFYKIFNRVLFFIALTSALIMMGTVGKIIADSRRETAVFRAIGAKRTDIAQIYLTYAFLLGMIIIGFALSIGWFISRFLQNRYSSEFTLEALVSFNVSDLSKQFSLVGFNWGQLGLIALIVIVGSLISAALPLFSNLRRNPIKDMRDER